MNKLHRTLFLALACLVAALPGPVRAAESALARAATNRIFNVLDYGAVADGRSLDSAAINRAITTCAEAGGGQVLFPPGRYLSGTVHLRSHAHLVLEDGARLVGTTNLSDYQPPAVPAFMPEARFGKWHRALIVGDSVEDVSIGGSGIIDGNKVFDPTGEEKMRGPHGIAFVACRGFTIRDVSIVDAANYAIYFQVSDDVEVRNVRFVGGWDGVHFRGAPNRWCKNVNIINCQFYTGDDSIAGRYWDNVVISGCIVNSSCNGIRLIGPATRLIVNDCLFYGPGEQPHRSSGRYNMLSGIILQPGAWDKTEGLLDNVLIANNTMHNVASPVTIWTKPGNPVGRITVSGLNATEVYRSALSVESWSDLPLTNVVLRNAAIEFAGGGTAEQGRQTVKGPGVDARPLPGWGIYARNVQQFTVEDVRLSLAKDDLRPVIKAEGVERLTLDNLRFPANGSVPEPLVTTNVEKIVLKHTDIPAR
jgi:polygalacturonase